MASLAVFENYVFHYVCKKKLFAKVDADFFKNKYIQRLYVLTKQFHTKFNQLPFYPGSDGVDQIEDVAKRNKKIYIIDKDISDDQNLINFMSNCRNILQTDLEKYSEKYLEETCRAWILWENQQKGMRDAIEWQKSQEVTPENVMNVIQKSREIINRRSSVTFNEGLGKNFLDPTAHVQPGYGDLLNCGFPNMNMWLSGMPNGGFEKKTTSVFLAHPNVGKSIFLGAIAARLMLNGENVYLPSLEMAEYKFFKRIGANIFDVPINDYSNYSQDIKWVEAKIREQREKSMSDALPMGNLITHRYAQATAQDIVGHALEIEEKLEMKFGAVILDYFTELQNAFGLTRDSSYSFHIDNMNSFYAAGVENDWAMITAHQLNPSSSGSDDITEQNISECKGLMFRPDFVFGIIQTPQMHQAKKYFVKNIKSRDSAFKNYYIKFDIDYNHMRLTESPDIIEPGSALTY